MHFTLQRWVGRLTGGNGYNISFIYRVLFLSDAYSSSLLLKRTLGQKVDPSIDKLLFADRFGRSMQDHTKDPEENLPFRQCDKNPFMSIHCRKIMPAND